MGIRPIALLNALRDRPYSRVDELAVRLDHSEREIGPMLHVLRAAGVTVHVHGSQAWALTRDGRKLLEHHERIAVSPASEAFEHMMRKNVAVA